MTAAKDLATLFAQCALGGFVLHHLQGDDGPLFVLTRRALTQQFSSAADVRVWLETSGQPADAEEPALELSGGQ